MSEPISGLTPDTTYHSQLCVSDEEETPNRVNCQTDRTFTTSSDAGTAAIAFSSDRDGNSEVHSMAAGGGGAANLTGNAAFDDPAAWSDDSTQVAFTSFRSGNPDIWVMNADGADQTNLTDDAAVDDGAAWSPDGTKIAYTSGQGPNAEVVVVDADGENRDAPDGQPGVRRRAHLVARRPADRVHLGSRRQRRDLRHGRRRSQPDAPDHE